MTTWLIPAFQTASISPLTILPRVALFILLPLIVSVYICLQYCSYAYIQYAHDVSKNGEILILVYSFYISECFELIIRDL